MSRSFKLGTPSASKRWKFLSRALQTIGVVGFAGGFLLHFSLICYYRATRPHVPQAGLDWTVSLPWCLGSYGTPAEAAFLTGLFNWLLAPFAMIALGIGIDYYKVKHL